MDAEAGVELLLHAQKLETEEKLFQRWINGNQYMGFKDFKAALEGSVEKPPEVILEDVGNILSAWEVERDGNI